jgi:hypothetical protein
VNGKWTRLGIVVVALLIGLFAVGSVASAQGPAQGLQPGGAGRGLGGRGGFGGPQDSLVAVAAQVLGMDQATLVSTLNSGKTIADVAKDKGVALDKIVDAFVAERAEALKSAVAAGRMTQAQADTQLAAIRADVMAQLNAPFTPQGYGSGTGLADADQDGVCDQCGAAGNQQRGPGGRRGR